MTTGAKIALGCAIAAGVVLLLLVVATIVVVYNAKRITGYVASKGAIAIIDNSPLPEEEKADARVTVKQFLDQAVAGKISEAKVRKIMDALMSGSVGRLVMIGAAQQAVRGSGLSQEAKNAGVANLQKFMAGYSGRVFTEEEIQSVLDAIPKAQGPGRPEQGEFEGGPKKPDQWTDEEVRVVLSRVEKVIAGKEMPEGGRPPIEADDIRAAIKAMKEALGKPAAPDEPEARSEN